MHDGLRLEACDTPPMAILSNLVDNGPLSCLVRGVDDAGRALAHCHAGPIDVGAALVHAGYALNAPDTAPLYALEQQAAKSAKAGAWAGFFMQPWLVKKY